MKLIVFIGPTLPRAIALESLDAIYLPPAAQGDVYRVARDRPFAIGIIDGYFERIPAVWHKEILWALSQGIHVYGAASIGALRAAELDRYGMVGVGAIYQALRSGELEDDDEVATAHGDESTGYRVMSEPMVNLRATLSRAVLAGVVAVPFRKQLEAAMKATFYPDRHYGRLLEVAKELGATARELEALHLFIRTQPVDQKRQDALSLLSALKECRNAGVYPPARRFLFSHTDAWEQLVRWASDQPSLLDGSAKAPNRSSAV